MKPTVQQQAFLDALLNTKENLALRARAGCGKTSTILMGVNAYAKKFPHHEITVLAYNRAIADEVKEKLKEAGHDWKKAQASTVHSLGTNLINFVYNKPIVEDKKVLNLIKAKADITKLNPVDEHYDEKAAKCAFYQEFTGQINSLVHFAKQAGVGFFADSPISDVKVWADLADHFDVNGFEDASQLDEVIAFSQIIYKESLAQTNIIDFDDMILFPLIKNLRVKFGRDLIFVDEAQDLSRARQALARKFLKENGRIAIIGDEAQCIYAFSGADAQSLENLITATDAKVLPLSVTWRCPKAVVALAKQYVPDFEAAPSAPEGKILYQKELPTDLRVGDAILCRNTSPLISIAYKLIRQKKACKVEGRSIGEGLLKIVGRWKIKTIAALLNKLEDYREREIQKARAKDNDQKIEEIKDRCETISEICRYCILEGGTSIDDVKNFINSLFADGAENVILLMTYHRSKGREFSRVVLWDHYTLCPSKHAKKDWQKQGERNVAYVAITRTKDTLVFVEPEKKEEVER